MFTQEQIKKLEKNKHVSKCSHSSINYHKDFKIWAVKKYFGEGYSPRMIFEEAEFEISIVGKERVVDCLRRWRKKYSSQGEKGLSKDNRGKFGGRKKKRQFKTKDEEIEYLKAKIAYMDAENDFLAKLRGLKREQNLGRAISTG